ncbi:YceD family protein [Phormidium sp. CCY1219]|uniref:YceD family protein n=1 Tax=Phormidium sp. CCY1219 TaxID=2886104 RepID=UPI002D1F1217|nr:YceD family protein [Phormidium sp. CCY1219]MEB3827588.1 YceD family protein [Phormidium sp. CCY1219]
MLEEIYIPQLTKAPERTETIAFQQTIPELDTLTPVRGRLSVAHRGNYLEVSAEAETIITLTCYRCLQQYNHRLKIKASEIIWLDEEADRPDDGPLERETPLEELVESLSPYGYFDPQEWLYQQLCLEIPSRQLCDRACSGIEPTPDNAGGSQPAIDRRWAALEQLKNQLSS